ncbi:MAG TPA: 2-dehydropantoate 2-reductase [Spirochaetota bacterium]|nr:2-dehydropantoate 2-reductase [Spirochaetota bacterium]
MKAGIIGAGSLGCIFSYIFYKSGLDFVVYEKDNETVQEIQAKGLTVSDINKEINIKIFTSSNVEILSSCDLIFLLVKSYSTEEAIKSIKPYLKDNSIIISLQNGIGNFETICNFIDKDQVVYGTTTIGASKKSPSHVIAGGYGYIKIGSPSTTALNNVVSFLNKTTIELYSTENPSLAVWEKAIINAGINPIASVLNITNGEIIKIPFASSIQDSIVQEACTVAAKSGIEMDYNSMLATVKEVCQKTAKNKCSMLQDVLQKRKTEIDSINGFILKRAKKLGLAAPVNETMFNLIKSIEKKYINI